MKTTTFTCDNCGRDITTTDSRPRYRLISSAESMPHDTNRVAMISVSPPFEGEKAFCGIPCLKEWVNKLWQ